MGDDHLSHWRLAGLSLNKLRTTVIKGKTMDDYQIVEKLKNRFWWTRTQGGQHSFADMETGENDLSVGHLYGVLAKEVDELEQRKRVLEGIHMKLKPLAKSKVYQPLKDRVICEKGLWFENTWIEDGAKRSNHSCTPFEEHLKLALKDQEKVDYLLDLLAFKYQKPDQPKPHAVVYLYHAEGGNGKSVFAETLKKVFGDSAVTIASESKMNSGSKVMLWAKTLLIAEEAAVGRGSDIYDTIKTYSGQGSIDDDTKHQHFKRYEIPANLFMMSNRAPTFVEPHDRRFFIAEWAIDMEEAAKADYFTQYVKWLTTGGYEAIAGLLARRIVSRDMYAPVPMTDEKRSAMCLAQDECVQEIMDLLEDKPEKRAFPQDSFKEIFEKHQIKKAQEKHKLLAAGLKCHDERVKAGDKKITPWLRQGDSIKSTKGVGTFVVYEGKESPIVDVLWSVVWEL